MNNNTLIDKKEIISLLSGALLLAVYDHITKNGELYITYNKLLEVASNNNEEHKYIITTALNYLTHHKVLDFKSIRNDIFIVKGKNYNKTQGGTLNDQIYN